MRLKSSLLAVMACLIWTAVASANTGTVSVVHPGGVVEFSSGWRTHLSGIVISGADSQIGYRAYDFCKRRLEGKVVRFFTWTTDNTAAGIVYDDDGLAFAKITHGRAYENDIAVELLERGLATVDRNNLPDGCEHYLRVEHEAQQRQVGIWNDNPINPPAEE